MLKQKNMTIYKLLTLIALALPLLSFASTGTPSQHGEEHSAHGHGAFAITFLWIAVLLVLAKTSALIEKYGQPAVVGELLIGVLIGNLVFVGIDWFEAIKSNDLILFLAELGVVILLFQVGLESNIEKMKNVGVRALLVASVGVVVPFVLGTYLIGPILVPNLSHNAYLFLGATLTATSVGITARVFRDLKQLARPEAQIVLGAAVIDDVIGLIILAVVSAIVTTGNVNLGEITIITLKAFGFLAAAIMVGLVFAKRLSNLFARIHAGTEMKFTLAFSLCLLFAYLAHLVGLAPIVGAFAAGLILEAVHFENFEAPTIKSDIEHAISTSSDPETHNKTKEVLEKHTEEHLDELIKPIGWFLVPIFFIMTGMQVNLTTLLDVNTVLLALGITVVAFAGKIVAGFVAGKGVNKWLIGWGMAPRGEVGLIFAVIGKQLGVVTDQMYSVIVIMVILTTLLTPLVLTYLLHKNDPTHEKTIAS